MTKKKQILVINTVPNGECFQKLQALFEKEEKIELVDAAKLNISHCIGCNFCWLKTPGICTIKDDYEKLLPKLVLADDIWVISDTAFGFLNHAGKNFYDRLMPLITMYLHFKEKEMRHIMRYKKKRNFGLLYTGDGDRAYLEKWNKRCALNLGGESLGVFPESEIKEAVICM